MAALKDYKWEILGDYQVADDLTLNNPVFVCSEVNYTTETRTAQVVLCFTEGLNGVYVNYRSYDSVLPAGDENIDSAMIVAFVAATFPTAIQLTP
tara:strand:- start:1476 stop:1760 length:285 start_codon:yes stop_codon:yes gene_type:complete